MVDMGCIKGDEESPGTRFQAPAQCYFLWLQGAILSEGPEEKNVAFPLCGQCLVQGLWQICINSGEIVLYDFSVVGGHEE